MHKKARKRRIVVDYRRVNSRTLRAVYYVRNQEDIVMACAGSVFLTLVDACKGFNQIVNTDRARRMLAILARSGQFLPRCLTFGPTNGPEDFAYATDQVYAPGVGRRKWFCDQWQIYADDITIRTGRVRDGVLFTDDEDKRRSEKAKTERIQKIEAGEVQDEHMVSLEESLKALGFAPKRAPKPTARKVKEGGAEARRAQPRRVTEGELGAVGLNDSSSAFQSPFAHGSES